MNYEILHDNIICRARLRQYDQKTHQLHHVVPIHEDPNSTDVVPLTLKEHIVIHRLRWKMVGTIGNKMAYLMLKASSSLHAFKIMTSEAGKLGGKLTKSNNLGIFSPDYDRGAQTKKNWASGVMDHIDFVFVASNAGKECRRQGAGIFREDLQHMRSNWAKLGAEALENSGNRSGCATKEWMGENAQRHLENCRSGGRIGGKIVGSLFWWTNGSINVRSAVNPGEGFCRGMTKSFMKGEI